MRKTIPLLFTAAVLSFSSEGFAAPPKIDFAHDVQPILGARCNACHGGDKRSGGLSTKDYDEILRGGRSGGAILPGDSKNSLLIQRITERAPLMPLGGPPLKPDELAKLTEWIEEGARLTPDSAPAKAKWMPVLSLSAPEIPSSGSTKSSRPVDRFIAAYYEKQNAPIPPTVPDAVFARRAYLDIWGLLPSPEEVGRFVQSNDEHKREALADTLLGNSKDYSEHWISFWNDLLRNEAGDEYHGGRKTISPWLYKALEMNLPYDRFVSELLNPATPSSPDGFLMGVNWRGDVNASQTPVMQAAQNSAQVFLGINLKCNSCHDSFISRWKLKDAYGLAAFFAPDEKLELVRCDRRTGQYTTPSFLYPELNPPSPPSSLAERRAAVAQMFTDRKNGRTARTMVNRMWQRLLGRGIVSDVDDLDGEPWNPQLLDWLASDFVDHGYDLKHLIRTIVTSQAYQMPSVPRTGGADKTYVFRGPELRRISAEEYVDAIGAITGEWQVYLEPGAKQAVYSREWRLNSTPLSRAMGRPIRDQVYTERDTSATTLQALELVNGATLTRLINRGADRMLGQLRPPPKNIFDSGQISSGHVKVDLDVSGLKQLRLVVADSGSYSPERVLAVWAEATLERNGTMVPLSSLKPVGGEKGARGETGAFRFKDLALSGGVRADLPSEIVYDLAGKGFTKFHATVGLDEKSLQNDISPSVRFFAFSERPDWEYLVQVKPETPLPRSPAFADRERLITRVFEYALGREATPSERELARKILSNENSSKQISASGLADLLWSLTVLPEFQLIA